MHSESWRVEGAESEQTSAPEQGLAQYAFIREEREREVRLLFKDVPPDSIARSFYNAGARLISLAGERLPAQIAADVGRPAAATAHTKRRPGGRRSGSGPLPPSGGEVILRYFYALGELVYTVQIASPAGIVESVGAIYPVATLSEQELWERLGVVFLGEASRE